MFAEKTNSDGWNWRTLLAMARDRDYWSSGVTWREWRLSFTYTWYDGPMFQLRVGPLWVLLSYQ